MFCLNCGAKLEEGALFCENCGTKVFKAEAPVQQPETPVSEKIEAPVQQPEASVQQQETPIQQPTQQPIQPQAQQPVQPQAQQPVQPQAQQPVQPQYQQPVQPQYQQQGQPQYQQQGQPQYQQQGQPQYQQPGQPVSQPFNQKPSKKSIPTGAIVGIVAAVIVVAIIGITISILTKLTSPYNAAKKYFKAESDGNYEVAYSYLELPDSPLLSYDFYLQYAEQNGLSEVSNYKVKEVKDIYLSNVNESEAKNSIARMFDCEYVSPGKTEAQHETVTMVKLKKKKWLFFNDWKMAPSNIAANEDFILPMGQELLIGGVDVSSTAEKKENEVLGQYSCIIPPAFPMEYEVVTTAPGCEEVKSAFNFAGGTYYSYPTEIPLTKEASAELTKLSEEICKTINTGSVKQSSWSEVSGSITIHKDAEFDLEESYTNQKERYAPSDYRRYESREIEDFKTNSNGARFSSEGEMYVDVDLSYTEVDKGVDLHYSYLFDDEKTEEPFNEKDSVSKTLRYVYNDGKWELEYFY